MKFHIWVFFENLSSFGEIWQEWRVLCMKTTIHLWSYLSHFFLEWEILQTKVVEKIKTHILYSLTSLRKSCRLWDNVKIYIYIPQITTWRMRISRWVPKSTNTHSQYVILIAFSLQQWLHERASLLRHSTPPVLFVVSVVCHTVCALPSSCKI